MSKKAKNNLLNFLLIVIFIIFILLSKKLYFITKDTHEINEITKKTTLKLSNNDSVEVGDFKSANSIKTDYKTLKSQNNDFQGWLIWGDNSINQPILKNPTTDFYLRRDFNKNNNDQGAIFIPSYQTFNDQNTNIYGHYIYADPNGMLTPLERLRNSANYETMKYFYVVNDRTIDKYVVASVINYDTYFNQQNIEAKGKDFDPKEWKEYIDLVNGQSIVRTDVPITENGKYVTITTCVRNEKDLRTIVVGKLLDSTEVS